jgi:hypothetical protein
MVAALRSLAVACEMGEEKEEEDDEENQKTRHLLFLRKRGLDPRPRLSF